MIFGRHSVLKRGCSTWDSELVPQTEFESRLAGARQAMAQRNLDALVIYGDNYSFADICYLTNYFPKVRGGIAVVPRSGQVSLLLNIGSRDVPFAKTLTWVDDVRASNQVGAAGAELLREKGLAKGRLGLVDSGNGFPLPQLEELKSALPEVRWTNEDALFEPMRLKKSPLEVKAMRDAGRVLDAVCAGAEKLIQSGRKEYAIVADIDRLARDAGAEDIRILAGEKRLQPPSFKQSETIGAHWAVYLAIQYERYWAEAGRTYILSGDAKLKSAYDKAKDIVARMAGQLKPGNSVASIDDTARRQLGEAYTAAAMYGVGNGIGLNQWEAPFLSDDDARQVGARATNALEVAENMAMALRVVFEAERKLILFGDTFLVMPGAAAARLGR